MVLLISHQQCTVSSLIWFRFKTGYMCVCRKKNVRNSDRRRVHRLMGIDYSVRVVVRVNREPTQNKQRNESVQHRLQITTEANPTPVP